MTSNDLGEVGSCATCGKVVYPPAVFSGNVMTPTIRRAMRRGACTAIGPDD